MDACASTNLECMRASEQYDPGNLWITATTQSAGKGSRGRSWTSQPGNLFASVLLVNPCEHSHMSDLTFVAAVTVRNVTESLFGQASDKQISLKWPNDVLLEQRKISGILLESSSGARSSKVVVGIGVNCSHYPQDTLFPATSLAKHGVKMESQELFARLAEEFANQLRVWDRGNNFGAIRNMWLKNAAGIGEPVEVHLQGSEPLSGEFLDIDDRGQMLIRLEGGTVRQISVGDVFFPAATPAGDKCE